MTKNKSSISDEDFTLLIYNWRTIQPTSNGLIVTFSTCEQFSFPNLTMDDFHEINYCNKTVKMPFSYLQENLICDICHGKGTLDWIDNITKYVKYTEGMEFSYLRNPKGPIRKKLGYYFSTPHLKKGQYLCSACYGSGLYKFNFIKMV